MVGVVVEFHFPQEADDVVFYRAFLERLDVVLVLVDDVVEDPELVQAVEEFRAPELAYDP